MDEGPEDKMDPGQPLADADGEVAGPPRAAAPAPSKSQQSAGRVQHSASAHREPSGALPAHDRRSNISQQQSQKPQARESAVTADKQSVATSKTDSKLFLISASTASVAGSTVAAPETVAEPVAKGKGSAGPGLGSLTRPSGSLLLRGPRSRSAMSIRGASSSRGSVASRNSKNTATFDWLPPGLQSLIVSLADTKDVGLIAYLSAIPGEPHSATRPPAAVNKLQQKATGRPKSIMKMSKPTARFEPTYRLEPLRPFRTDRAHLLVHKALEAGLEEASYSVQWATDATRILAAYITQCVKAAETQVSGNRYKIATVVTVMERRHQGVRTEGAMLWDHELDRIISATVENNSMIATAVVYAVYWE